MLDRCGITLTLQSYILNCDTFQRTKQSNKNNDKLPAKVAEEIPWNKLCLDPIGPYVIHRKRKNI